METFQVAQAVRRAIQYTVALRVTQIVQSSVPGAGTQAVLVTGAAVLLVALRGETGGLPSARVAVDLSLIVASNVLVQAVLAGGHDSLPLTLAHLCCVLELGGVLSAAALGDLAGSFLGQIQYTFAKSVAALLLSATSRVVALVAAGGLAGLASWRSGLDSPLATGLSQASVGVLQSLVLGSIPVSLKLPTIAGMLAFVKPLHASLGIGGAVYSFALYQAGDSLQEAIEAEFAPFVAACAAVAASLVVPIESLKAAAQIAAVGSSADWVVGLVEQAADRDPVPSLLALLVFCRVLLVFFEAD